MSRNNYDTFDADVARNQANNYKEDISDLLRQIDDASAKGAKSMSFPWLDDKKVLALRAKKFKVEPYSDQRESWTTVSWG